MKPEVVDQKKLGALALGLGKDVRIYFRSGLVCIILWILLAIMIPSWRQPWSLGYNVFFYCLLLLPLLPILIYHFRIFLKIQRYCSLTFKNTWSTFVHLFISLIIPLGALLMPRIVIRKIKKDLNTVTL